MNYRTKSKRLTRYEAIAANRVKTEMAQRGEGIFLYRNNTKGDLTLPKPSLDGKKTIPPKETWTGDDYFMQLVRSNEARLVETIKSPEDERKAIMEQKLLVDQPDRVTVKGKVEHVVVQPQKKLNENTPAAQEPVQDVLITEDPLAGVEIITD